MPENDSVLLLPAYLGTRDLHALFDTAAKIRSAKDKIVLDCQDLQFVDPLGFSVLAATLEPLNFKVEMPWLSQSLAGYMQRMNFFHRCPVAGYSDEALPSESRRDTSVEITRIEGEWQVPDTAHRLATTITTFLTDADPDEPVDWETGRNAFLKFQHPLAYALTELLMNALTHARREGRLTASVWVAAQVVQSSNLVRFSVVDDGCGMLGSLRRHSKLAQQSHSAAINLALRERVSCNRDGEAYTEHGNQGVGLTVVSRIAGAARGNLTITSGDSCVLTGSNGEAQRFVELADGVSWNGVAVSFECRRGLLPTVRIKELLPAVSRDDLQISFT